MNDETKQLLEDIATLALSTDEVQRKRALVSLLGHMLTRPSGNHWEAEAARRGEECADLRQQCDDAREALRVANASREYAFSRANTSKANAETLARDLAEARSELEKTRGERDAARALRSGARNVGSPEREARVLTEDEFTALAGSAWRLYDEYEGGQTDSFRAMLRWLEREGYLSVRLPPKE